MKKFLLAALLLVGCQSAKEPLVDVVADAIPKTVMIANTGTFQVGPFEMHGTALGSGVFISPEGHILTCAHLFTDGGLKNAINVELFNGDTYGAEILYVEAKRDLAIVRIYPQDPVPFAVLADPRKLKVGQAVIAVGNPLGLAFSVCHGIISALGRDFAFAYNTTQSDTMINGGNSGGPLFNMQGELVGINSFIITAMDDIPLNTGLAFSISPGQIIEFLTRFKGLEKAIR